MIIILAHQRDEFSRRLAAQWAGRGARLLTPRQLSRAGWVQYSHQREHGTCVIGDEIVRNHEITGVLTRLVGVIEDDLEEIMLEDRGYVQAEMTAFLFFWLSRLNCPVLNRPTPACLAGPYWSPEQWSIAAKRAGMRTRNRMRSARGCGCSEPEPVWSEGVSLTVIGDQCFGSASPSLIPHAKQLARIAGADLLQVRFETFEPDTMFIDATVLPEFLDDAEVDAVIGYLQSPRADC